MANWVKLPNGKFAGSKGGSGGSGGGGGFAKAQGATTPGGLRGLKARARLGAALKRQRELRVEAKLMRSESGPSGGHKADRGYHASRGETLKGLARARRAVKLHQREVARVEKRGLQRVGLLGKVKSGLDFGKKLNTSRSQKIGIRQDRLHFAKEKLQKAQATLRRRNREKPDAPGTDSGVAARKATASRKLRAAIKAVRNRQRELSIASKRSD